MSIFATRNLYADVIVRHRGHSNLLQVVSGYSSPAMVQLFLEDQPTNVRLEIVLGMTGVDGLLREHQQAYQALESQYAGRLKVFCTGNPVSIHTKLYVWSTDGHAECAFVGSANFTQRGLLVGEAYPDHSELLVGVAKPDVAQREFNRLRSRAVPIRNVETKTGIARFPTSKPAFVSVFSETPSEERTIILPLIALRRSPKTERGEVQHESGLNWGVRRNSDQASISYPAAAKRQRPNFFPIGPIGNRIRFAVVTDDGYSMTMIVAQDGEKSLHSVPSNATVGEYFRRRLGVASRQPVTVDDLRDHGSRFVQFEKLDDETFRMTYTPEIESKGSSFYDI